MLKSALLILIVHGLRPILPSKKHGERHVQLVVSRDRDKTRLFSELVSKMYYRHYSKGSFSFVSVEVSYTKARLWSRFPIFIDPIPGLSY